MTDTPPDWVLIEAAKRFGWDRGRPLSALQQQYKVDLPYAVICDMILKHEQPPIDRKLLCAREAERMFDGRYRTAEMITVRAVELWEEGFGK